MKAGLTKSIVSPQNLRRRKQRKKALEILFQSQNGRTKPLKSELRRRGIWQGLLPHVPDDWGRQLAAGRSEVIRTPDLLVPNKYTIVF